MLSYNFSILAESIISKNVSACRCRVYWMLHLILFLQNLLIYSHFPFGVLQFKLFIFAVWILDWIRVRVQFNLNQRRKLESRGGTVFDTAIKKHSFGYGSRPMAA